MKTRHLYETLLDIRASSCSIFVESLLSSQSRIAHDSLPPFGLKQDGMMLRMINLDQSRLIQNHKILGLSTELIR